MGFVVAGGGASEIEADLQKGEVIRQPWRGQAVWWCVVVLQVRVRVVLAALLAALGTELAPRVCF
jgi:hypothetical protein